MYPKKITEAMKERICKTAEGRAALRDMRLQARRLRRVLPSSKKLAHEAGVSVRRVQEIMSNHLRKSAKDVVSRGAFEP